MLPQRDLEVLLRNADRREEDHNGVHDLSKARFSINTFTRAWPKMPHCGASMNCSTRAVTLSALNPREAATRAICSRAASGLMCGSRPLAEAKTMSAGTTVFVGRLF